MANLVVGIRDGSPNATYTVTKKKGVEFVVKRYTSEYDVIADNSSTTEDEIIATPTLPSLYSLLRGATCKSLRAREASTIQWKGSTTTLWTVTAEFDSSVDKDQESTQDDPTNMTAKVSRGIEKRQVVITNDVATEDPVINANGEKLIITDWIPLIRFTISRIETYPFDPDLLWLFVNRTNSQEFWGAPPGTALLDDISTEETIIDGIKYEQVSYKVLFWLVPKPQETDPEDAIFGKAKEDDENVVDFFEEATWQRLGKVLHEGWTVREAPGEPPKQFVDENGNPGRINLTSEGLKLPDGEDPEFLEFNVKLARNLNLLNLGPFA